MDDPNMHAYGNHYQDTTEDILRDVCELEPANPSLNDTICVDISDLKIILDRHLEVRAAVEAAQPEAGEAVGWKRVPIEPTSNMLAAMSGEWHSSRHEKARKQYAHALASAPTIQPTQPVQEREAINHLEKIYGYLCSVAPEGIADEAFRNVPEALLADSVRHRIAGSRPSVGNLPGAVSEHVGSSSGAGGRTGEAVDATPAQAGDAGGPSDGERLTDAEQRAVLADPGMLARLIGYHDAQEAAGEAMEDGWGKYHERRALELLAIGRKVIAEDPGIWEPEIIAEFKPRYSERATLSTTPESKP